MDHKLKTIIIEEAFSDARNAGVDITQANLRDDFVFQYRKMVTKLRAESNALKNDYEMVQNEQNITPNTTLAAWLIKNQSNMLESENQLIMDFRAPIEIEIIIAPSQIL